MSNSDTGRDDFDRDDDLRALLRGGDPAASLSPADPAALQNLLEDIMSADLEVRPEDGHPDHPGHGVRATGTHGRSRSTWLVAAAAAAVIAGVGGYAATTFGGDGSQTPTARDTTTTTSGSGDVSASAPLAGETTVLGVAEQQGRCAAPTPAILAQYPQAFEGTVTAIEGDTVTLAATDVLAGEVGETVQVTAPPALFGSLIDTTQFAVGGDYLVAAFDGQVSMCYSGSAAGALRSPFEKAFVR